MATELNREVQGQPGLRRKGTHASQLGQSRHNRDGTDIHNDPIRIPDGGDRPMMGDLDWFSTIFGAVPEGDISWNARVAKAMVRAGLSVVMVAPDDKTARCLYYLDARGKKAADTAAQQAGTAKRDGTHRCGVYCSITEEKQLNRKGAKELLEAGANLAVSLAHSTRRVMIVDVDTDAERRAFLADWREHGGDVDETTPLTVASPGVFDKAAETWKHKDGGHIWFDVPDGAELPAKGEAKWCRCHQFSRPGGKCEKAWSLFWTGSERYVLVPPSVRPEGPYRVTGEVLEAPAWLIAIAHASVNRTPAERTGELNNDDGDPINAWASSTPWAELLTAAAWSEWGTESCGCSTWTRPGHANPKTGTAHDPGCGQMATDGGHGFLHLWTDAWRPAGKSNLTKLEFAAHIWHGGDVKAAMEALGIARTRREGEDNDGSEGVFVLGKGASPAGSGAPPDQGGDAATDVVAFWEEREVLTNIRQFAIAKFVSPWAMLGAVLAYAAALTPPRVTVKAIDVGSLNLFVGLVGAPGAGKDVAREAARAWFGEAADDAHLYQREIGTGQGLVSAFVRRFQDKETKESVIQQVRESILVTVSEIDQITAHAKQQASTLVPTLRSAWMAQLLGGLYKDTARDLSVGAHTYRLCLVVGIQPAHARALVGDAGGGLPQRFLWMPATDPTLPELDEDEDPPFPEPWQWKPPVRCREFGDPFTLGEDHQPEPDVVMGVCDAARREFRRDRWRRATGRYDGDELDTHALFSRLKVAAALALLDQRTEVSEDDWRLADTVMAVSRHVRGRVLRRLEDEDRKQRDAEQQAQVESAVAVERAKAESTLEQAKAKTRSVLARQTAGEWMAASKVRKSITASARVVFEDAVNALVSEGIAEREDRENGFALRLAPK
jgi:hypothetical protein